MKTIRIYNQQGGWEILGGLVGGPLFVVAIAYLWLSGGPADLSAFKYILVAIGSIALPFYAAYWFYRALVISTLWIEFGEQVVVAKLLRRRAYSKAELGRILFDSVPIEMDSSIPLVSIPVAKARFLTLQDRARKSLGVVRITPVDRASLIFHLQNHGGRYLLPRT